MRYTIAAVAAFASLVAAVPQGYYAEPPKASSTPAAYPEYPAYPVGTPSSKAPEYPAYPVETPAVSSKTPEHPASYPPTVPSSKAPEHPAYPASSAPAVPSSKAPEHPSYPASSAPVKPSSKAPEHPVYPASSATPAKPSSMKPAESCVSSTTITVTVPYPTNTPGYPAGPKPSVPAGGDKHSSAPYPTGTAPGKPAYPTGTGAYTKPSTPAQFTGAASSLNAAGFVAGVGAFAAFFL